jgi:hypothetical protein
VLEEAASDDLLIATKRSFVLITKRVQILAALVVLKPSIGSWSAYLARSGYTRRQAMEHPEMG